MLKINEQIHKRLHWLMIWTLISGIIAIITLCIWYEKLHLRIIEPRLKIIHRTLASKMETSVFLLVANSICCGEYGILAAGCCCLWLTSTHVKGRLFFMAATFACLSVCIGSAIICISLTRTNTPESGLVSLMVRRFIGSKTFFLTCFVDTCPFRFSSCYMLADHALASGVEKEG